MEYFEIWYILISFWKVKHRVADIREATGDQNNDPRSSIPRGQVHQLPGRKWLEVVKSTRTFFLILVAFIITWGPYAIVNAVDVDDVIPLEVHLYVSAFAHMHAAANCVIYGATSPHFRSAYKRVLCMKSAAKGTGSGRFSLSPTVFATQGSVPMETCARVTEQQKQEFENEPQKASPEKFKIARTRQNRYSLSWIVVVVWKIAKEIFFQGFQMLGIISGITSEEANTNKPEPNVVCFLFFFHQIFENN